MSSFIGHSLAGLTIYHAAEQPEPLLRRWTWASWLMVLASAPDLDYVLTGLRIGSLQSIRITHSFVGVLVLPILTGVVVWFAGARGTRLRSLSLQAVFAGLSHLVLDLLVGVTALPLLWPFTLQTFKLPFGILPDAGQLHLDNPLLYYNTLVELGALLPIVLIVIFVRRKLIASWRQRIVVVVLGTISVVSMGVAFSLAR